MRNGRVRRFDKIFTYQWGLDLWDYFIMGSGASDALNLDFGIGKLFLSTDLEFWSYDESRILPG